MKCKVCGTESQKIFTGIILSKYKISYFFCQNCFFLQTEEPYWLGEAYKSPINTSDTGYVQRNIMISKILSTLLALFFDKKAKYLYYAGGYGILVRLMRDIGFDFYWYDKYTQNIFSKGFEFDFSNCKNEAVTVFECFEHFRNPIEEIENLFKLSDNLIFSTSLLPKPVPKPQEWWYYGIEHGQHISFYSYETMKYLANRFNTNYYDFGGLQLFTRKKLPKFTNWLLNTRIMGLQKILFRKTKGKTWEDHIMVSRTQ